MIKFKDGSIDPREVYKCHQDNMGNIHAIMYDPSTMSFEEIQIGDMAPIDMCDPCCPIEGTPGDKLIEDITCTNMDKELLSILYSNHLFNLRKGKSGIYAQKGDIVKVVKGRKYPKDYLYTVYGDFYYDVPGTYGKKRIHYLDLGNNQKIDAFNVEIVDHMEVKEDEE